MVGELPNHIELIYKNAEDNLRFIKQQQWSIARYALTAYGALFVVAKTIRAECADKVLLVLAAWLVAVFSVLILWSLIESMATFRGRIANSTGLQSTRDGFLRSDQRKSELALYAHASRNTPSS